MRPRCTTTVALIMVLAVVSGCRQMMMPTPVLYHDERLDPFSQTPEEQRRTIVELLYATDRQPRGDQDAPRYGNGADEIMRLGSATVRLGDSKLTWQELQAATKGPSRPRAVPLYLLDVKELGTLTTTEEEQEHTANRDEPGRALTAPEQAFVDDLNRRLAAAVNRDLTIYVHGFNVDFANPCLIAGELHHFMAATSVVMAYAWPARQSFWHYAGDVRRARASAPRFARLVELLAAHSDAQQINILSYSAGGPLVAEALFLLRERYADLDPVEARRRLRIGRVIFAAATINLSEFRERFFYAIDELAKRVVMFINPTDLALVMADPFSLGRSKLGAGSFDREKLEKIADRAHLHITDVSVGEAARHNDWIGHAYWYGNPWVSSDVLASLRFRCPPDARGLVKLEARPVWYFPDDYPVRIADIVLDVERNRRAVSRGHPPR